MPSAGGQYRMKNGKRELVHRTKPTPTETKADDTVKAERSASKPAKAAAKQEEKGNE